MNELNINNPASSDLFIKILLTLKDWRFHSFSEICSRIRNTDKNKIKDCIEELLEFESKTWGSPLIGESISQTFSSKEIKKSYCISYNGMRYLLQNGFLSKREAK